MNFLNKIVNIPISHQLSEKLVRVLRYIYLRSRLKDIYITERYRSKDPKTSLGSIIDNTDDVAILMRGLIVKEDDFTIKTLEFYRKCYPNTPIILSTWDHCINGIEEILSKLDIKTVTSKFKVPIRGYGTNNLQIIGNMNGLHLIREIGIKYTLTTRTDQRFYADNILRSLKLIQNSYDYKTNNNISDRQINRLAILSFNTFLYRLYSISDMFLFGLTEDVFNFWNTKYDDRKFSPDDYSKPLRTQREWSKQNISEAYFTTEFLARNGEDPKWTLEHYWDVLRKRFIVVDSNSLDFLWPKYSHIEDRWINPQKGIQHRQISNSDWNLIRESLLSPCEEVLDFPLS
ncbi:WavE lipopolysaccharide synthesis family protein [Prochlorococcus sp. MIT 1341]|uniref:WavE lipopolysaccharide synthesis family protein n=1 Tax=Prochlorococcus sp. MIT 1341 TaxID=3096221 RepID=UPI002A75FD6C|nr:WavE lipopolysaccharide synthesis family protein [Prochlorococcus sp. MIT 1341]